MEPHRVFLRGEIDVANADGLITTLRRVAGQGSGEVVVDCMDLTFMDAAGIRALILVHSELAQQNRDLCLVHPSPFLARVLQLLDLTYLLRPIPVAAHSGVSGTGDLLDARHE
jgi:anti-anti-sigma factor